jgi:hypothetical protein
MSQPVLATANPALSDQLRKEKIQEAKRKVGFWAVPMPKPKRK